MTEQKDDDREEFEAPSIFDNIEEMNNNYNHYDDISSENDKKLEEREKKLYGGIETNRVSIRNIEEMNNNYNHYDDISSENDEKLKKLYGGIETNRVSNRKTEEEDEEKKYSECKSHKVIKLKVSLNEEERNTNKNKKYNSEKEKNDKIRKYYQEKKEKTFLGIKSKRTPIEKDMNNSDAFSPLKLPAKFSDENLDLLAPNDKSHYDLDAEKKGLLKVSDEFVRKLHSKRKKLKNDLVILILVAIFVMRLKMKLLVLSKFK